MAESAERDPRVYFAAERTFLAWIRTGLGLMGVGFAVARFGFFLRQLHASTSTAFTASTRTNSLSVWSGVAIVVLGVLVTALGSTVIGFSFQTWAQQYTTPSHTAIFISLEPVFAVFTSWLLAREHLGGRILLGAGLILAGILLAELKGPAPIAPESPEPIVSSLERVD